MSTTIRRPASPTSPSPAPAPEPALSAPRPRLSPKRQQQVAIAGLLLALLLGGGIIYWFVFGTRPRAYQVRVDPKLQQATPFARRGTALRGVEQQDANTWQVRGEAGFARVVREPAKGTLSVNFGYARGLGLPEDQRKILTAATRAPADDAMARQWGLSPEQVKKLKAVDLSPRELRPGEPDRQAAQQLFEAYLKAPDGPSRMDAQKRLTDKLDAIARAHLDGARKTMGQRAADVRAMLTPEQVDKILKS